MGIGGFKSGLVIGKQRDHLGVMWESLVLYSETHPGTQRVGELILTVANSFSGTLGSGKVHCQRMKTLLSLAPTPRQAYSTDEVSPQTKTYLMMVSLSPWATHPALRNFPPLGILSNVQPSLVHLSLWPKSSIWKPRSPAFVPSYQRKKFKSFPRY